MSLAPSHVALDAPARLAVPVGTVLGCLWPAFLARAEATGLELPAALPVRVVETDGRTAGVTERSPAGVSVTVHAPGVRPRLPALRHVVAHELGHVLAIAAAPVGWTGIGGEYVAERLGWEIASIAGLWVGREITDEAADHRSAQRGRADALARLHEDVASSIPGAFRHRRARAAFGSCARSIIDAEAYALAGEHALGRPVGLSPMSLRLARLVRAAVAPLAADPLPGGADGLLLRAYLEDPAAPGVLAGLAGGRFASTAEAVIPVDRAAAHVA